MFLKANVENIKIEYDLSRRSDIRFSSETLISRLHVNAAPVVSEAFSITKIMARYQKSLRAASNSTRGNAEFCRKWPQVTLMQDMQKELEKEGEADKDMFDKFMSLQDTFHRAD